MTGGITSSPPRTRGPARDRFSSRGQSLTEFAILIPVLVTILLLAVDVGRVYLGWVTLHNVARIGANFAAANPEAWQGDGDSAVQARYRSLMARDAAAIDCTLPDPLPDPTFVDDEDYALGTEVQVDLTCTFSLVTPFLSSLIGDGAGNINVGALAVFAIRSGSVQGVAIGGDIPTPTATATPTATPTATATATATPDPSATPGPSPSATATAEPRVVSFYGVPTSADSSGGGAGGETIVGIPNLAVTFFDTSTGPPMSACTWDFGDGETGSSCGNQVNHTYTTRGTFTVSLTIDGVTTTRVGYVVSSCKVPAFAGVHKNSAAGIWTNAGFDADNISYLPGNGNYKIGYQSLAGGIVNPPGGCDGAQITVGP